MTLLDVCEPLFQYVCRLSRAARKGASAGGSGAGGRLWQSCQSLFSSAFFG